MTDKNNGQYLFADYDEHRKAPIPRLSGKIITPAGTDVTMTSVTMADQVLKDIITT